MMIDGHKEVFKWYRNPHHQRNQADQSTTSKAVSNSKGADLS